ncbi:MAG: hypothetical protein IKX59_00810 [Bacteroidales bacterium]|nr:hypothetical protein [Bacteroidales bacterium]
MKKAYSAPELEITQLQTIQIICQSISYDGYGNGRPAEAKRRNPIFDDEEDL